MTGFFQTAEPAGPAEAATLYERLAGPHLSPDTLDPDRLERRLNLWRRDLGVQDEQLDALLKLEQLHLPVLSALLGASQSGASSHRFSATRWSEQLLPADERPAEQSEEWPFLTLIAPALQLARTDLRQRLAGLNWPGDLDSAIEDLFVPLQVRLQSWLSRTMVLELHVARLEGRLKAATPELRFQEFIASLGRSDVRAAVFEEYQVLGRMIAESVERWTETSETLLRRLATDWPALRQVFGPAVRTIAGLTPGMGDTHRRGQAVCTVDCGALKVMYKPRSLAVDVQFQDMLTWLNGRLTLPFRTLKVLDRETHGYVEFVESASCTDRPAAARFYQRQGGLLALMYVLRATDFHFENVIASGEHPVPIDLEALFHPVPVAAESSGHQDYMHSVLHVGLLPHRMRPTRDDVDGVEVSGLNGIGQQGVTVRLPSFNAASTDQMRFERRDTVIPGRQNRPQLGTQTLDAGDFVEEVVTGFQAVYRVLVESRSALLDPAGPLSAFADVDVRYIARPTQTYATLLFESFHPDYLRSGLDRDRVLSRLWLSAQHHPRLTPLLPFERADLNAGDIPLFSARPGSRDLWASDGTRLPDQLVAPCLDLVRAQLGTLGERDLERQSSLIRASFTSLTLGESHGTPAASREMGTVEPLGAGGFLEEACRIGERLETLAFEDGDRINWYGLRLVDGRRWQLMPLDYDLYSGLSGLALFLGELGQTVGNTAWSGLARRAIREGVRQARQSQGGGVGFAGLGGLIYAAAHLGALWGDEALLADADAFTTSFRASAGRDEVFDVIGGSAGGVLSALALHQVRPGGGALEAALACGERLLAKARSGPAGRFWQGPGQSHPLMGFSHGGSGIALALARLGQVTGRNDFLQAARSAVEFERSHYNEAHQNWPDFRDDMPQSDSQSFMWAWCHGAPGIAIGRAAMLDAVDDSGVRQDLTAALASTQAHGLGGNHSLCHGSLGNIGALLTAAEALQDPRLTEAARQAGSQLVRQVQGQAWRCGVPNGAETPGLMTGLAGIGYGLLRLASPSDVPDVLSLAAPVHPG